MPHALPLSSIPLPFPLGKRTAQSSRQITAGINLLKAFAPGYGTATAVLCRGAVVAHRSRHRQQRGGCTGSAAAAPGAQGVGASADCVSSRSGPGLGCRGDGGGGSGGGGGGGGADSGGYGSGVGSGCGGGGGSSGG